MLDRIIKVLRRMWRGFVMWWEERQVSKATGYGKGTYREEYERTYAKAQRRQERKRARRKARRDVRRRYAPKPSGGYMGVGPITRTFAPEKDDAVGHIEPVDAIGWDVFEQEEEDL